MARPRRLSPAAREALTSPSPETIDVLREMTYGPGKNTQVIDPNDLPVLNTPDGSDPDPLTEGSPTPVRDRLLANADALKDAFVERDDEVDLLYTALIAGDHCFFWGDPGVAKTHLITAFGKQIQGPQFSYLLTKFTDPSELFGPADIPALKAGSYQRVTGGMLPEAVFAFLDETIKGSSAILNCLLTLLNERRVKFGRQEISCPLQMLAGASNEVPNPSEGGQELGALFDRFLFRKRVRPVSRQAGRRELLRKAVSGSLKAPGTPHSVTPGELAAARAEAEGLPWGGPARKALWDILTALDKEGIQAGDRRTVKAIAAARAAAWLAGASEVAPEHLEILQHVLWADPTQAEKARSVIVSIANPTGHRVTEILTAAEDVLEKSANPIEASKKLKELLLSLEKLDEDPRRDKAILSVQASLKEAMNKVLGLKEKDNDSP